MRGLPTLLTPGQAAAWLGIDEDRLTSWREHDQGPTYVRITGRTIRYKAAELGRFRDLTRRIG
ncbi:hypothetical protein [Aeromicrobium alkaliterrae]|uniref:Helix-turn-helix domain-containing protein n=1 Tax=Aeromicrobium alkaliterrae TaxID=302168 RepID=A0ABN2KDX9_9ACTN